MFFNVACVVVVAPPTFATGACGKFPNILLLRLVGVDVVAVTSFKNGFVELSGDEMPPAAVLVGVGVVVAIAGVVVVGVGAVAAAVVVLLACIHSFIFFVMILSMTCSRSFSAI